jgi:hypothetical protein
MGAVNLPAGYNPTLAVKACLLSNLAYDCIRKDKKNPVGSVCVGNFAFIRSETAEYTIVAFQGSNDAKDFCLDAFAIIQSPEAEFPAVHLGFWRAVQAIIRPLLVNLERGKPIYLSGHSLGGGMALVAALVLHHEGFTVAGVYGFGTPRVGMVQFFNRFRDSKIPAFLIVHGRDGVAMLPPNGIQVASEIWLDLRAFPIRRRIGFSWINPFRWSAWRDDHSCDAYLAAVSKIAYRASP